MVNSSYPRGFYDSWKSQQWEVESVDTFLRYNRRKPLEELFSPISASMIASLVIDKGSSQHKGVKAISELPLVLRQQPEHESANRIGIFAHGYYYADLMEDFSSEGLEEDFPADHKFSPYCALGFAFWDKRRLKAMGLVSESSPDDQSIPEAHDVLDLGFLTWISILGKHTGFLFAR